MRLIKTIWKGLIGFIGINLFVYSFLAFCNWDYNPINWNGFSRFLMAIVILVIGSVVYDSIKKVSRQEKKRNEDKLKYDVSR